MLTRTDIADALRYIRERRGLSQEDFSEISSRTYMSSLERGRSSPTMEKLVLLCGRLDVNPVTLIALATSRSLGIERHVLLDQVAAEMDGLSGAV